MAPDRLRAVETADVYKAGRLAARLRRERDDVVLTYDEGYLADPAAPAIAVTLPKDGSPVRSTAGAVPAFFAGLLPEGARLNAVATATRTSADDHLTLLLAVGADTIGDVQVVPADAVPVSAAVMIDDAAGVAGVVQQDLREIFARSVSGSLADLDAVSIPGVQDKMSAAMISAPVGTGAGPAILKLDPPGYPHLVANEHCFLGLASRCGLVVPRHEVVHDRVGRAGLLVERFDRVVGAGGVGGVVSMLPQEDACQVLDRYPAAKYRMSLQEVAIGLADAVAALGGSRPLALRTVLQIAAYSYLIGNGDLHGKNLSIHRGLTGIWQVTPAYDLLTTQPYLGWQDPMALPLYGRANRLGRRWWLEAGRRWGLPEAAVRRVLDDLLDGSGAVAQAVEAIGFDGPTTARLVELIQLRRAELAG